MNTPGYPIRAAAKLSGLSTDTIRAWERRYKAVVPARVGRGRLYSEEQVARLRWLRDAVAAGHSISQVAPLSDQQVRRLLIRGRELSSSEKAAAPSEGLHEHTLTRVMGAIRRYDAAEAEAELSRLAVLLAPRHLVIDVLLPLLRRVGSEWHRGQLHIAHEHMVSAIFRSLLGALTRLYPVHSPEKRILMTTPSGEMHEFGILTAALLAVGQGIGVVYLGPDLPAREILRAAKKTDADVVLLGITRTRGNVAGIREASRVAAKLPPGKMLWIGGGGNRGVRRAVSSGRATLLENFQALERMLGELEAGTA
jgi:DNA-binding transcriptional MerR regulator/methylmalonyl-CoA mutase cobalamin-binding subunit